MFVYTINICLSIVTLVFFGMVSTSVSKASGKRKCVFLTIETKLEMLKRLSKGESGPSLFKIYNAETSVTLKCKKINWKNMAKNWILKKGHKTEKH